jgi:hypothetical protein
LQRGQTQAKKESPGDFQLEQIMSLCDAIFDRPRGLVVEDNVVAKLAVAQRARDVAGPLIGC